MGKIRIAEFCKESHVTRSDGARLREAIDEHWTDAEPLILDFSGVRIASVSFFDESLGLLAKKRPVDEIKQRIRVENIDEGDRELLNRIVSSRAKERVFDDSGIRSVVQDLLHEAGVPDEVLANWNGTSLALYQERGGASASLELARRIDAEKATRRAWTLDLGHYEMDLPRDRGSVLKARLDELDVSYEEHSLAHQYRRSQAEPGSRSR